MEEKVWTSLPSIVSAGNKSNTPNGLMGAEYRSVLQYCSITKSINNANISSHWFEVIGVVSQQPNPLSSQIRQLLAGLSLSKLKNFMAPFYGYKSYYKDTVYFLPRSFLGFSSWYSFDRFRKDERLSWP